MKYLIYIGTGFLQGIPAKDLTHEEVESLGINVKEALASGLYKLADEEKKEEIKSNPVKKNYEKGVE